MKKPTPSKRPVKRGPKKFAEGGLVPDAKKPIPQIKTGKLF
jgi:hypothetical protein